MRPGDEMSWLSCRILTVTSSSAPGDIASRRSKASAGTGTRVGMGSFIGIDRLGDNAGSAVVLSILYASDCMVPVQVVDSQVSVGLPQQHDLQVPASVELLRVPSEPSYQVS